MENLTDKIRDFSFLRFFTI